MLLNRKQTGWVWTTLILALAALGVYLADPQAAERGHRGSNIVGLIFGGLALAIFVFCSLLSLKRKAPHWKIGRAQAWLRGHVWFGLLAVWLVALHSGFGAGGPVTTIIWVLTGFVTVSALVGLGLQQVMPSLMLHSVPGETVAQQLARLLKTVPSKQLRLPPPPEPGKPAPWPKPPKAFDYTWESSLQEMAFSTVVYHAGQDGTLEKACPGWSPDAAPSTTPAAPAAPKPVAPAAAAAPAPAPVAPAPPKPVAPKPDAVAAPQGGSTPAAAAAMPTPTPSATVGAHAPSPAAVAAASAAAQVAAESPKAASPVPPAAPAAPVAPAAPPKPAVPAAPAAKPAAPAAPPKKDVPPNGAEPLRQFWLDYAAPYFEGRASVLSNAGRAVSLLSALKTMTPAHVHPGIDGLAYLIDRRRQLVRQRSMQRVLVSWLLVHVPISWGLLVLAIVHAVMALRWSSVTL